MDEPAIIEALLNRDDRVTRTFFYGDGAISCRGLLLNVLRHVYRRPTVDYDEAVGEFYVHLMQDDGRRLRMYDPSRHRLYGWIRTCAVNFFVDRAERERKFSGGAIENQAPDRITDTDMEHGHIIEAGRSGAASTTLRRAADTFYDEHSRAEARDTVMRALFLMKDKRKAGVLMQLWLLDADPKELAARMGVTVANLYNIKSRAMAEFQAVALRMAEQEKIIHHG